MQLNKAVALITGGALGLGRKVSETLLKNGASVIVADINVEAGQRFEKDSIAQFGDNKLKFLKCDVRNSKELHDTFDAAKACFGRLDIVCNNAGVGASNYKHARVGVDINLTAVIEGTFKGIELMSKKNGSDGGVIVNVASAAGLELLRPLPVYTATKHAVVAFTRCFSALPHYHDDGVRVNCFCPFFFETDLVKDGLKEYPAFFDIIQKLGGYVNIEDVVEGLMKCIVSEEMNGKVVVVRPPKDIFEMKFPNPKL